MPSCIPVPQAISDRTSAHSRSSPDIQFSPSGALHLPCVRHPQSASKSVAPLLQTVKHLQHEIMSLLRANHAHLDNDRGWCTFFHPGINMFRQRLPGLSLEFCKIHSGWHNHHRLPALFVNQAGTHFSRRHHHNITHVIQGEHFHILCHVRFLSDNDKM